MPELTRIFIAIEVPDSVKLQLKRLLAQIKHLADPVKWVNPKNLHITLKFLGEITPDELDQVKDASTSVAKSVYPFDLCFSQLGVFPNYRKARVLWTDIVEGREPLIAVRQQLEAKLAEAGFPCERKPFRPHLTLGRIKNPQKSFIDGDAIQRFSFKSDAFEASRIVVIKSQLHREGPIYTQQAICGFQAS